VGDPALSGWPTLRETSYSPTSLALQAAPGQTSPDKTVNCHCTTASFTVLPEPTGYPAGRLRLRCGVPTYPGVSAFYDVSVPCGKASPTSAHSFAAGFLSLRQAAPTDPPSRDRPCLKLVVVVSRLRYLSSIWTLVLRQGTFTPLVHARAGRTQPWCSGLIELLIVLQEKL
jgi:hypothetical protein